MNFIPSPPETHSNVNAYTNNKMSYSNSNFPGNSGTFFGNSNNVPPSNNNYNIDRSRRPIFGDTYSPPQQTRNDYININQVDILAKKDPKIQKVIGDLDVLDSNCNKAEALLNSFNTDINNPELVELVSNLAKMDNKLGDLVDK